METEVLPTALRRRRIVELVAESGFARVPELSARFGLSQVTIRSDLDALATAGDLERVHGGVILPVVASDDSEKSLEQTSLAASNEKSRIGTAAAALVESGSTVVLDVGSTTTAIALALVARADLKDVVIVTNALNIAMLLESAVPRFTVIVSGGTLRPLQHSLVEPLAGAIFDQIHADIAFIGCSGVDADTGITNVNLPEADLKRRMIGASTRVIAVADGSKIGAVHQSRVCGLDAVSLLITSSDADPAALSSLESAGLALTVV
jgi:DeoR family transcriptional regulator of aga operon